MSRESNLSQVEVERESAESQIIVERGEDTVIAAPNPGVIVIPENEPSVFPLGLSGSLTTLADGSPYLLAGAGISLSTGSSGAITISSAIVVGGSDSEVQYNDGGSALTGSSNFTFNNTTSTLRVTNLSGSLTKLSNGNDFLVAGTGITLSTGSNGSITVSSGYVGTTWESYTPTIGGTTTAPTLPTSNNLYGRYFVQGKMLTLMFSFSGNSFAGAAAGSGDYTISLPTGYTINTTFASLGTSPTYLYGTSVGTASLTADLAGTGGGWAVVPASATTLVLVGQNPSSASQPLVWGSSNFPIGSSAEYRVSFTAIIPVV
jgi:hypothetical protein